MTRRAASIAASLTIAFLATVLLADQGVVRTRDGATYEGDVQERGDNLVVTIRGVETVIPKANVAAIERIGSFDEQFRQRLSKLDPKDIPGRIALAREAFDQRRYDLARDVLENALTIDPNSREATDMLELVQSQIRMERSRTAPQAAPPAPAAGPRGQAAIERRLLTPADVEAIRKKELKPSDTAVRIRFEGDLKKRFADSQNIPFAQFNTLAPVEQAIEILDKGTQEMKDKVRVLSDPQSMMEYRRQVQPLVLANCAASGCHGGPPGGGLVLYTPADNDLITYTNFYILHSFSKKAEGPSGSGGVFGGSQKKMIDRGQAEQSLLLNYGLPVNIAEFDHPPVIDRPINPIFRNKQDARYQTIVQWMNQSLTQIEPDYGIQYTPPAIGSAATQPAAEAAATQPAATPAPAPAGAGNAGRTR